MTQSDYSLRFNGIARLYGHHGAHILEQAHFCIIGIGGVGSWVAEALARNGIGNITLIDLDDICISNINRQIHALTDTVGLSKVEVMAERIKKINPNCVINVIEDFVTEENLTDMLFGKLESTGPQAKNLIMLLMQLIQLTSKHRSLLLVSAISYQ